MKHLFYEFGYDSQEKMYQLDLYAEGQIKPISTYKDTLSYVLAEVKLYREAGIMPKPDLLND